MTANKLKKELAKYADSNDAVFLQRFFKTGPGEYGEGDQFIGVRVPQTRKICKQFITMPLTEIQKLLYSPIHEHRLAAVIILAEQYKRSKNITQKQNIFDVYLLNIQNGRINNWDIIDVTAPHIIGEHLINKNRKLLLRFAKNNDIWQRRAAIISTFAFIKNGDPSTTLEIAEILVNDKHDLIQKAVGWALREMGKSVDQKLLTNFLDNHAAEMPRTMLRYAIEKLDPVKKSYYMNLKHQTL